VPTTHGGGEGVCLGKALPELEIRLLAVGLLVRAYSRASKAHYLTITGASDRDREAVQVKTGGWKAWATDPWATINISLH